MTWVIFQDEWESKSQACALARPHYPPWQITAPRSSCRAGTVKAPPERQAGKAGLLGRCPPVLSPARNTINTIELLIPRTTLTISWRALCMTTTSEVPSTIHLLFICGSKPHWKRTTHLLARWSYFLNSPATVSTKLTINRTLTKVILRRNW